MPVAQLTAQHMFKAELRRAQRDDVSYRTTLVFGSRPSVEAQIVNMSPYGFMARAREDASQGDTVAVTMPGDRMLRGNVVWALGGRVGVELDQPVGVDDYQDILSELLSAPQGWDLG